MDPSATRRLEGTDVAVTALGLGTAPLGGMFEVVSDEQASGTIDAAWAAGIRFFDTAPLYGHGTAELRLGAGLRGRDGATVSTKVGRLLRPGTDDDTIFVDTPAVRPVFDFSAPGVRTSLQESLARLGVDRVDIVLVHDPDDFGDQAVAEAFPELASMREAGSVGAIGAGMNQTRMVARFVREVTIDCVLLAGRYTLLDQSGLDELLPLCEARGVSVIAGGVFNSGILADPRPGATYDYAAADPGLVDRAKTLRAVCEEHGVALTSAALQFPAHHPAVATVLTGARTASEVSSNVAGFSTDIPRALWTDLKRRELLDPRAPTP